MIRVDRIINALQYHFHVIDELTLEPNGVCEVLEILHAIVSVAFLANKVHKFVSNFIKRWNECLQQLSGHYARCELHA